MFGIIDYGTVVLTCVLLNLIPGADTMYILSRSMSQGRSAGLYSALGITAGTIIHTLLAALGLSLLLVKSIVAFTIVKWLGAAYLIYLGVKMFRDKSQFGNIEHISGGSNKRTLFVQGMLTNVMNPKVALFFLSFIPQFINPSESTAATFVLLGFTFTMTGFIWSVVIASIAGVLSGKLQKNQSISHYLNKIMGSILVLLGIKLFASK